VATRRFRSKAFYWPVSRTADVRAEPSTSDRRRRRAAGREIDPGVFHAGDRLERLGDADDAIVAGHPAEAEIDVDDRLRSSRDGSTQLRDRAKRLEPRDCDPLGICHVIPTLTPATASSMPTR